MKRTFETEVVLKLVNNVSMNRELMDHLFPGIFTMGAYMMVPTAQAELVRQHPKLRDASEAATLPAVLTIEGPLKGYP
jgi:hypothetical protein